MNSSGHQRMKKKKNDDGGGRRYRTTSCAAAPVEYFYDATMTQQEDTITRAASSTASSTDRCFFMLHPLSRAGRTSGPFGGKSGPFVLLCWVLRSSPPASSVIGAARHDKSAMLRCTRLSSLQHDGARRVVGVGPPLHTNVVVTVRSWSIPAGAERDGGAFVCPIVSITPCSCCSHNWG